MIDIWKTNAQNFTRIGVHMYEGCQNFRPLKLNCPHASKFRWVAQKQVVGGVITTKLQYCQINLPHHTLQIRLPSPPIVVVIA